LPNFVKIGQFVAQMLWFSIFKNGNRPPYWIFKIVKHYWLCGPVEGEMHHPAKFQNWSIHCGDIAIFRFKVATVCHLGLVYGIF